MLFTLVCVTTTIESISNNWANYVQHLMSNPGTWCDNKIIQAVANANSCVIHITESDTITTPIFHDKCSEVIFIGYMYINELHYVSTVPNKINPNRTRLAYLKSAQSTDQKEQQVDRRNSTTAETID